MRLRASEWIFGLLVFVAFGPALLAMAGVWSSVDYYSHGYLVPVVALWAAWAKHTRLLAAEARRDPRGLVGLVTCVALYGLGFGMSSVALQGAAFVGALASVVLFLRGPAWLSILAFPLGYLVFMVPLPEPWTNPAIVRLQLVASSVAVGLLQRFGVPVYRNGNVLTLPGGETLGVEEACSGITSIITLVPLAVFLAYFTERSHARRAILVLAVLPLAVAGNLIRVVGTVIAAGYVGVAAAAGPLHEWAGLFTYALGCVALLAVGSLMRRCWPEPAIPRRG